MLYNKEVSIVSLLVLKNLMSSIRNLHTRKFGTVGEILVSKIIKDLEDSDHLSYDRKLKNKKCEIKVSRAFQKAISITEENICEVMMQDNLSKMIKDQNKTKSPFFQNNWCKIFISNKTTIFFNYIDISN